MEIKEDFTHIIDIVDGLIKIALQIDSIRCMGVGSGINYSVNDVLKCLVRI